MINRLLIVHGTGRCGTALLSYFFGGCWPDRYSWAGRNRPGIVIAHEPLDPMQSYWDCIDRSRRGYSTSILENVLLPQFESLDEAHTVLITDNKLGRWFIRDLVDAPFEIKVIHLERNPVEVARSIEELFGEKKAYKWCHRPDDADRILPETSVTATLSAAEFHIHETRERWLAGRAGADECGFETCGISFETFLSSEEERRKLEEYCGFSGFRERLCERVNARSLGSPEAR